MTVHRPGRGSDPEFSGRADLHAAIAAVDATPEHLWAMKIPVGKH